MIVIPNARMAAEFMENRLQLRPTIDCQGALFAKDGKIGTAMTMDSVDICVLWDNFIGRTCTISIVIQDPTALTRTVLRECFRYPFEVAGLEVVMALVDSNNHASIELCSRAGFAQSGRINNAGIEADLIIFTMAKSDCRWIRQEH